MSFYFTQVRSVRSSWRRRSRSRASSGRSRQTAPERRAIMTMISDNRLTIALWVTLLSFGGAFQWLT